jgi:hypothetical protein
MIDWPAEHREHVARVVAAELERRGFGTQKAADAANTSAKSINRILNASDDATPRLILGVTRALGIPDEQVQMPRPPAELSQLDRIEAMLCALLDAQGIAHDEAVRQFVALGDRESERRGGLSGPSGVRPVAADDVDEGSS